MYDDDAPAALPSPWLLAAAALVIATLLVLSVVLRRSELVVYGLAALSVIALLIAAWSIRAERRVSARSAEIQGRYYEELQAARSHAVEADRAKSRFLATVSHDMRQPLHALALYVAALERRVATDDARKIVGNMDGAIRTMSRMFSALLDLARLEAGALDPQPEPFRVGDLLADVVAYSADPNGGEARVTVVDSDLLVESDPNLLEIALRNLVSNALKHSDGGRVLVGCRRVGSGVNIEVHDTGPGIEADKLEALFNEFVRGESARPDGGIGLGLAIVDGMTELLGHRLSVRSEVGKGTVFSILVPRADPEASLQLAQAAPARLEGVRILVADNEDFARDAMRQAFEDAGALVEAASSAEAVRVLGAGPVDLYVFDLNLGAANGIDLLEELEQARGEALTALIVTGATTSDALAELKVSGREWLTKPASAADLTKAASRILGRSRSS